MHSTATALPKMSAIPQLRGGKRHVASRFIAFFDIENPCYGQLTAVKTRHVLTRIK